MDVGPIMFGGTPGIINYFRGKSLLATIKDCGRCYIIIIIIKLNV